MKIDCVTIFPEMFTPMWQSIVGRAQTKGIIDFHTVQLRDFAVNAYGQVDGPMTEDTPFNPCSRKGEVRAAIAATLLDAMRHRGLTALIARSVRSSGPPPGRVVHIPLARCPTVHRHRTPYAVRAPSWQSWVQPVRWGRGGIPLR